MRLVLSLILISFCQLGMAQVPSNIEAVEHDPVYNRFFVSNGNNILVTSNGGVSWDVFGSGSANYGMEVMGNTLFVISNNVVRGYDLTTEAQVMTLSIPGVSFLNGMGSDGSNKLFVSDFGANRIYAIDVTDLANPTYETAISNTVSTPNGITIDLANNRGVFVNWGSNSPIKAFDLTDYSMTTLLANSGLGNCDGIDHDEEGNFYVSSWTPTRITRFSDDFATNEIVTAVDLSSPADISYAIATDTLAIANSGSDEVTFIGFSQVGIEEEEEQFFSVYPSPMNANGTLQFSLEKAANVGVNILSIDGKLVHAFPSYNYPAGQQRLILSGHNLSTGNYIIQLIVDNDSFSRLIQVD
jgi:sugar lactone lactonase YvrE